MPVNETLWLRDALAEEQLALDATIVNACYPQRFTTRERTTLAKARKRTGHPLTGAALGAALSEHARMTAQREQLARLREGLAAEVVELPYLFAESFALGELDQLADALEGGLRRAGVRARQRLRSAAACAPARSPDSIAPSMNPAHPLARSEPAKIRPGSARRIAAWCVLIPAGAVDGPCALGELVGQPVVRGGAQQLVAGEDRVQLALHGRQVAGITARRVGAEADHELRAVAVELL